MIVLSAVPRGVVIPMIVAHHEIAIPMIVALLGRLLQLLKRNRARCMPALAAVVPKEVVRPLPDPCAKRLNGSMKVL